MSEFIGRFHPVLVHLPIGILLVACFFQLLAGRQKYLHLQHAIGTTLFWGMISAVAACITGYLLAGSGDYDETLAGRHQWFGISVAVVSIVYYVLHRYTIVTRLKWILPVALIFLLTVTGHLGGSLTHGSDYLTGSLNNIAGADTAVISKPIPDVQEAVAYAAIVQPLLQNKCYGCHGASKQKGKLRMDQPDLLMKGGKSGVVIEAGNAAESELIKRILLEKADEHHMPPKEKAQLTEKEIALLHWWVASGASFDKKTKDIAQTEKIKPILLSLQNTVVEKERITDVPAAPVEKAAEAAIEKLRDSGIVVQPVALNSNYLMVSFVAMARATDKVVQLLAPLKKQLVWLKLNDTRITDTAINMIAQCNNITRLELGNTGLTDEGLGKLSTLQQLQSINLVGTKVTAAGLLKLKDLKMLRSIYFYRTGVKNTDWNLLKQAFPAATLDSGGYQVPLFDTDTMLLTKPKNQQ
ncbi:MAG: c-type cytochrome domain-containing protein [Chitinophagaceae bacterium]